MAIFTLLGILAAAYLAFKVIMWFGSIGDKGIPDEERKAHEELLKEFKENG